MDPIKADRFRRDFHVAQKTVSKGVSVGQAAGANSVWDTWYKWTASMGLDLFLQAFEDKIPVLQVFAHQVRSGELAPNGNSIRA